MRSLFGPGLVVLTVVLTVALALTASAQVTDEAEDAPAEKLIVFLQQQSPLDDAFRSEQLPAVTALARELGVELEVLDASAGAPQDVTITPLIAFQNHRGRAIYQGRFDAIDRVRHFVFTARHVAQGRAPLQRDDVAVWESGRARVAASIKVTPLTGAVPEDHDAATFAADARRAITEGLKRFAPVATASLRRGDRTFYFDCYPYRGNDGTLHLSLAIFSQFHCEKPIFRGKAPITGPWGEQNRVFAGAGAALEVGLFGELSKTSVGDAFHPIPDGVPNRTWRQLGQILPAPPERGTSNVASGPLPTRWVVEPSRRPGVLYHFLAPLDYYTGTATKLTGELDLVDGGLVGAAGWVAVDTRSIRTGDDDLDDSLGGDDMLASEKHPLSRFDLKKVETEARSLVYGEPRPANLHGAFALRGITIPLDARVTIEPVLEADGTPRLLVRGAFRLRLEEPFGILGPDGPSPAKDTVIVTLDFAMKPRGT